MRWARSGLCTGVSGMALLSQAEEPVEGRVGGTWPAGFTSALPCAHPAGGVEDAVLL